MTPELFDFAKMLSPLGSREFFSRYWERQHLVLQRNRPDFYESLMTTAELEAIIPDSDARYPAIRLAKAESDIRCLRRSHSPFAPWPKVLRSAPESWETTSTSKTDCNWFVT
jgi:ribosomal protein L16 Arg81 hydroxylase